jgi:hypothetical protein
MQKNEQKPSVSPETNTDVPAPSTTDTTSKSWAAPVSDELKTPNVQPVSTDRPSVGSSPAVSTDSKTAPGGTPTEPKVDDPVSDRNGRAPNPPTPTNP